MNTDECASMFQGMNDVPLEGEILSPGAETDGDDQEFNTLDEPVRETIVSVQNIFPPDLYNVDIH